MRRSAWLAALAFLWPAGVHAAGLCATATDQRAAPPYLAILSAFPAELAPLVAATTIDATVEVDGRQYYLGRLDGVSVVLGLTGIGIVNATNRTRSVVAHFELAGLVMSGVAGSRYRIGDVVVADEFVETGRKGVRRANPALLALAARAATALPEPLQNCTPVPPTMPGAPIVCLPFTPAVILGGQGVSGDPFGGKDLPCAPGGDEIFGCALPAPMAVTTDDVQDMETAAVARAAARRRLPFLGVRAASDGEGDPLGDRGFPAQFFDYYRLAAHNAADVTRAVVSQLSRLARDASSRSTCRLLARHRWRAAARRLQAQSDS